MSQFFYRLLKHKKTIIISGNVSYISIQFHMRNLANKMPFYLFSYQNLKVKSLVRL